MDQNHIDPEIAQEVIALLHRKISNLRTENAQLQTQQNQLSNSTVKTEDGANGASNDNTQRLLEEIEHWKSELERRPHVEEVSALMEKLERNKQRKQDSERNLQSQIEHLQVELAETRSAVQGERAVREALEEEIHKLCNELNHSTKEKEEALARLESQQLDNFDVPRFLRGTLEELPPMPNPVVVAKEGVPRPRGVTIDHKKDKFVIYVNGDNTIKWAVKGGGCVVPFPPAVYSGSTHAVEKIHKGTVENRSFELFGVDGHLVYYGTYRCIKVVTMDWNALRTLDSEFSYAFLATTVVQDGHAAPVVQSIMENMYQKGILGAVCAVLRCEGFDHAFMEKIQSATGPSKVRNITSQNYGKRSNYNGGSQGASKRAKLTGGEVRTQRGHYSKPTGVRKAKK